LTDLIEKTLCGSASRKGGKTAIIQRLLENLLPGMNIYFMESAQTAGRRALREEIRFESAVVRICI
jgi:hypothetical protein